LSVRKLNNSYRIINKNGQPYLEKYTKMEFYIGDSEFNIGYSKKVGNSTNYCRGHALELHQI